MAQGKWVAYYRVSTARQGQSGLGLEAQRKAVADYLDGGRARASPASPLVAEFTEVESGKRADRPELAKALAACRLHKATLIIAKLDRLSRNAHFLLGLQEAGVRFVAADMPEANEMVVGILAVVAQAERKMISDRTKAALAAVKARGRTLGTPRNLTDTARQKGRKASVEARQEAAKARDGDVLPAIREAQERGATSLRQIAALLNTQGIPTARGKLWNAGQVSRVMGRSLE